MKNERTLLFILASAMFAHIMDFMIMMPLGPQLMRTFAINPQQFSLLVSSYTITAGITGFLAAFFIDRYDRKKTLLVSFIGFAIGTLACAFAPTYLFLLVTRSIAGAFGGVLGALILAIVSDVIPLDRRAKSIGVVMASFSVASVAGVPFGLYLAAEFSWHAPFLFLGIFCLLVTALITLYVPPVTVHLTSGHSQKKPREVLTAIFGNPHARLGLTFSSVLMLGHFAIIPFLAPYMVGNVGFSEKNIALIYLVGGALTIFFSPWVGKMADKHGRIKIFTIFAILALIPVAIITNMPPLPLWQALVVTGLFFIFLNGRMIPATTMETALIAPENRGSYMSIRSSIQQLASGLASFGAGLIIQERPSIINPGAKALLNYPFVGIIAICFSVIAIFIGRRLKVQTTK